MLCKPMLGLSKFAFLCAQGDVGKRALLLAFGCLLFYSVSSHAKVSDKDKFIVQVIRVRKVGDGCTADVQSDKIRYEISSHVSGDCAMLRAGETYKVFVSTFHPKDHDSNDKSKDMTPMVIEDNKEQGTYAVFTLDSQEVRDKK